jgi:hypothetical protein
MSTKLLEPPTPELRNCATVYGLVAIASFADGRIAVASNPRARSPHTGAIGVH